MSRQEKAIQDFMRGCLVIQKEEQAISRILTELGKYYDADRVYIFEIDEAAAFSGSQWEWCGQGVPSRMENRKYVPLDALKPWLDRFAERGEFFLAQVPEFWGADCLMAAPIVVSEKIKGFLGVDAPRRNTRDLLLLSVAASFSYREISSRRREDAKLEKTEKEMTDRVNQGLADQRKLSEANKNLTTLLAEEKQYTAIVGAMSNVYFGLYYIDLENNTFQELFAPDKIHHTLGEKGDAREALRHMTAALVGNAYLPAMLAFTDYDTIDRRLGNQPIIVQDYAARSGGWTQCAFIPVERDANGKNRTVMCTLRWITAEKEVESQGNLIQALAIPYENIYTVNADTQEAIYYCMGQTMTERYGHKFAAGNYEYNIQTYIDNDVLAEDRHLFDQVRTVAGVNALLTDKKTYYFNYRVHRDGRTQYFQCQLVKPNPGRNEFVIGFKDFNKEKNIELAAQLRAEQAFIELEKVNAALQEESTISTALSKEYSSLFQIDARTRKMTLYRTDGVSFNPDILNQLLVLEDYEIILSKYIHAFVAPEDRDRLRESIGLSVLTEKVPDSGLYKLGFRRSMNGVISYFEMNLVKTVDSSGAVTFILGLRDVDEEARRQLKQTREMEVQREIIEGLGSEYCYEMTFVKWGKHCQKAKIFQGHLEEATTTENRHWPLCYTRIGYRRSMVRLELYCLISWITDVPS